jgi:hypothetical protein
MTHIRRATIEFDADASDEYKDLVAQTLRQSEYITTQRTDDGLVVYEIE